MSGALKSTYRPPGTTSGPPGLPTPWTQHKAPSGHIYYYNPETKQSTYRHPGTLEPAHTQPTLQTLPETTQYALSGIQPFTSQHPGQFPRHLSSSHRSQRSTQPQDRPKSKAEIPGFNPWILVSTKLGRRFVHNSDTKESFWKVPDHLTKAIVELDIAAAKKRAGVKEPDWQTSAEDQTTVAGEQGEDQGEGERGSERLHESDNEKASQAESDEYEEIEVTDDEDEHSPKRQRLSEEPQNLGAPPELGEDDMAYQLAQMGEAYDLDPGEYGEQDFEGAWEEGAQGLELSAEEAELSFKDLLDEHKINPYTTWDAVIADGLIIDDNRYTLLPNMKARKDVFAAWSIERIQQLKQQKENQTKQNPRIPYLAFLESHANPKLYWPEFKRKHKRERELKDSHLSDKDREKLYREHIARITKMSESAREDEFALLLKSIPPSQSWNRSTSLDDLLPSDLLSDIRFISISGPARDAAIKAQLRSLPTADQIEDEDPGANAKNQEKRERLKKAVERREQEVRAAKRQQEKDLRYGQRQLHDENLELEKAMKVDKTALGRALNE